MSKLQCPKCLHSMGLLNFTTAPTPLHMKCENCHAKLKLASHVELVLAVAVLLGVACYIFGELVPVRLEIFLVVVAFTVIIFETLIYSLMRRFDVELKMRP